MALFNSEYLQAQVPIGRGDKKNQKNSKIKFSSTMVWPVLSLSSLSSKVVLDQDLDTRELPLHLHRELEQYRRLEGVFTLLQVEFWVERIDGGEVNEEDREFAMEVFLGTLAGQMILSCDVYEHYEDNRWSLRKTEKQRSVTMHMESPASLVHNNLILYSKCKKRYRSTYLESGKLTRLESNAIVGLEVGDEWFLNSKKESFCVSPDGKMTWLQQYEDAGLLLNFTNTGTRTQCWGDTRVFYGEEQKLALEAQERKACPVEANRSSHLDKHKQKKKKAMYQRNMKCTGNIQNKRTA